MAKNYNDFQPANLMSFAKSFARLNGQPLDKSEIWYSLAEAQAYATTAAAYVGQILAVIDEANNKVSFFGITDTSGTLTEIGAANVDALSKTVEELNKALNDDNGIINQVELIKTAIGSAKNEETGVEASGFYREIDDVKTQLNHKANTADVYSKEDTDLAISQAIAGIEHLTRKIVNSIADIQIDIDNNIPNLNKIIYLVPALEGFSQDIYDEYMVINGAIEKMGSWEVNLENYVTEDELTQALSEVATKTELATGLSGKVNVEEGKKLSTNDFTTDFKVKLEGIQAGAEKNIIQTVSGDFSLVDRHLNLNSLSIEKITGLQDELNKKINAKAGYGLLSADDQKKLDKLVIDEEGQLGISGSISADNVIGLEEWLNKKAGTVTGLSENNLTTERATKLDESLFISSVNTSQLRVTLGKLEIIEVDVSKINGLETALNNKVAEATNDLTIRVNDISESLGAYVLKEDYDKDIADIRDILTWKEII